MDLNRLRYFYTVAKLRSFTAAAKNIHVSQPSLSKMVKQLEEEIGETLFLRGKKGVELTAAGALTFGRCQNIFSEVEALQVGLTEIHEEISGNVALGASDNLCNYILPTILDELTRGFPKLQVNLFSGTSSEIQSEILDGKSELGLFYTKPTGVREFEVRALRFVEFVIVSKKELKLKELSRTPYVGSRRTDYRGSYPALEMLKTLGIKPSVRFETNNQETQKKLALMGSGYTIIPLHMVDSEIAESSLHRVITSKKVGATIFLVKRRAKLLSRPAQVLEKIIVSRLGDT